MEVNTRLQVEHLQWNPSADRTLVKMQLQIAQGEPLHLTQKDAAVIKCHAIEHRINAEDSEHNFTPCPGTITEWIPSGGLGVRVDSHSRYTGYTILLLRQFDCQTDCYRAGPRTLARALPPLLGRIFD